MTMYTTLNQAVMNVVKLLQAHGYDAAQYDVLSIADEYRQETGGYESIFENPSIVWAYVDQYQIEQPEPSQQVTRDEAHRRVHELLRIRSALTPFRDPSEYDITAIVDDFHNAYGHCNIGAPGVGSHDLFEIINRHYFTGGNDD